MAICKLTDNLLRTTSCGYSLPEIVDLYLVNYEDLSGTPTFSGDDETGCEEVTGINLKENKEVFHIEPNRNSASFEDTLVVADNGTKYRNASITFTVAGQYDACMHAKLDALSLGRYFTIVKTADGNYLAMGRIAPLEAETVTLAGGSDTNGMTVTLSGNIAESPMPLSEAAKDAMLAKVHESE